MQVKYPAAKRNARAFVLAQEAKLRCSTVELFDAMEMRNPQNDREANGHMNCIVKAFCKAPFFDQRNRARQAPVVLARIDQFIVSPRRMESTAAAIERIRDGWLAAAA